MKDKIKIKNTTTKKTNLYNKKKTKNFAFSKFPKTNKTEV